MQRPTFLLGTLPDAAPSLAGTESVLGGQFTYVVVRYQMSKLPLCAEAPRAEHTGQAFASTPVTRRGSDQGSVIKEAMCIHTQDYSPLATTLLIPLGIVSTRWKPRLREVTRAAQGHPAGRYLSQDARSGLCGSVGE